MLLLRVATAIAQGVKHKMGKANKAGTKKYKGSQKVRGDSIHGRKCKANRQPNDYIRR